MGSFRRLNDSELGRLSDEALVDYIVAAREAGERQAEKHAVGHLAFGFERTIFAWVRMGMGSAPREDIEDVVIEVQHSAIRSSFEGKVIGEFGAFLKRITQRRVADFFRQRGRQLSADPLAAENQGDDRVWGGDPYEEDFTASAELRDVIDRVLARRSEQQREVIRLYGPNMAGFLDLSADEVADRIAGMSTDNVHKIWSRFRQDLKRELDG